MEWLWALILAVILFGPIVFVMVRGRKWGVPTRADALGSTGYGAIVKG